MPADDDPPTFDDATAEARYYRLAYKDAQDELEDLKLALQDFQASSKELEDEMEKDLAATEKREQELRNEAERLRSDLDGWKSRHQTTLKDHSTTLAHMHKELESLRASEKGVRAKLRDMELDNDDLEKSERAISSTLSDMENRYNKAVERTALLEQELVDKARLEEELQRVKDELRDTTEELAVLRDQHDDALAKAALANNTTSHQSSSQALPVTPSSYENGDTANGHHRGGIPSPDIDSADEGHHLSQQAMIAEAKRPSLGQSSASSDRVSFLRASPSKLPVSTFSSPDDTSSSPIPFPSSHHQQQRPSSPTPNSAAISRSLNARNLSSLASRKSLTPKTLRDKRTDSVVGEMQDMTTRMQKLTAHLNSRRESMMAGSAIPRARPSLLPVTPASNSSSTGLPRSSSTKSSISRSGSVRRGMNGSPSMQFSTNTAVTSERDEFKQPISTRPPSRLANSSRASVASQRPQSRLSVNPSRPVTPSARSPTPSSANYSSIGLGNLPGAVSTRSASRRISIGPGGVRKAANPPVSTMPGGSAVRPKSIDATSSLGASTTKSASKPAPVWR